MKKINELIPIEENNGKKAVNARYLHAFLESKQELPIGLRIELLSTI